jgi:hypothetical protein
MVMSGVFQPEFLAIAAVSVQWLISCIGVGGSVLGSCWPPMQAQAIGSPLLSLFA